MPSNSVHSRNTTPQTAHSAFYTTLMALMRNKFSLCGLIILGIAILLSVLAPWISPQNPYDLSQLDIMDGRLKPGSASMSGMIYWLGTDDQGRDLLSAMLYGMRTSLLVGVSSAVIALTIGAVLGLISAWAGGKTDALIMRIVDIQLSFPPILIALILLAVLGQGVDKIILALVVTQWAYYARTVRGSALLERRRSYVDAAQHGAVESANPPAPYSAQLPAAADRRRHHAHCLRDYARGHAVISRHWLACHRTFAGITYRQRVRLPDVWRLLDQRFPWHHVAGADRGNQLSR